MVDPLAADYQSLDIDPKASRLEVEQAYLHRRALYADGSLASYGLLEQPQKQQRLQEIEAAYARIVAARQQPAPPSLPGQEEGLRQLPDGSPASQLRQARLEARLTLKDLAQTLKIGHRHLQNIEEERFEDLPATVYLRGFLLCYAKALKIAHPEDLASRYLACRSQAGQGGE
jgi:DNA-binding XRE family transcriptional regulator